MKNKNEFYLSNLRVIARIMRRYIPDEELERHAVQSLGDCGRANSESKDEVLWDFKSW